MIQEEKEYLEKVLIEINKEIEKNEKKLKELCKIGTTLSFEDKKRGDHFNINAQAAITTETIDSLKRSIPVPYFGRIDFVENNSEDNQKIYIGRKGIASDSHTLITDWRAPVSSLYYDSEIGSVSYMSPMGIINGNLKLKRQINIKDSKLIDIQDSSLVTNDELLKPYLSVNADNKMKTIIASIQKEQNYIIRKPTTENIIVQGVAGSGKTSVALHRIAYLIYALGQKIKASEFLIIGPNKYFLNYISSVLPELDTSPVMQKTFLELLNESINENLSLDISEKVDETEKNISHFKSSLEYKEILDKFIDSYLKDKIVSEGIVIDNEEIFSKEYIRNTLFSSISKYPNFTSAFNYIIKKYKENMENIYERLNAKYRSIYLSLPKGDPKRNEAILQSEKLYSFLKKDGIKYIKEYFKKINLKIIDIYKLFIINIGEYSNSLSEKELLIMQKNTLENFKKKKISFPDMAALMYLNFKLHGENNSYQHIVIDEAQDYGMFHFAVLKEIFPHSTYSIYGDLAQAIYSYQSITDWESVKNIIFNGNCELININRSYRTTKEITNNANKILSCLELPMANPVVREGNDVSFVEKSQNPNYMYDKIIDFKNRGYQSIAIICKTDNEAKKVYEQLVKQSLDIMHINLKDKSYNGGICVLTSALAKGLEFDAVIINDASLKMYDITNKVDMHLLYVACTRALHSLEILYEKELCQVFNFAREIPKARKLTR